MSSSTLIGLNNSIHDRVLEFLRGEPRGWALDVGTGDGTLAARMQSESFNVKAVDLVTTDFRPTDIEIRSANLNNGIPYDNGQFDAVAATEVIEHLENPWFFVRELYRVTKPNGVVVVSTPNLSNVYTRLYYALTGRMYNFLESAYRDIGHITPVYLWNLKRMAESKFEVEAVSVNASPIPKTPLRLPTKSRFFGQCIVVKLRRLPGDAEVDSRLWTESRILRPH